MNRKLRLPLALAMALGSSHVLALGLGQIEVKSGLYQPLDAQIPVLSSTPSETANLKVRLASPEDFARVGLDSSSMLSANLEFSVRKDASGKPVIHVTTDSKLNDPFVTFLLEVDWGKGRLLREFTVLLDPPLTAPVSGSAAPARVPSAMEPVASEPVVVETLPAPEPQPVASMPTPAPAASTPPPSIPAQTSPAPEPVAASAPAPVEPEPAPSPTPAMPSPAALPGNEYGPTISGDTLWSIASRVRPAGVDMNQTMLALLNANPDAFIGNNINRLRKGAILRIPSASDMVATGLGDARMEVARQMDAWRASVGQAQPQPEVADTRSSTPTRRDGEGDRSRLELVPPKGEATGSSTQTGVAADSSGTELRRDLQRAREDINARDQEITDLKSRVGELEKIESDSKRLIDMQNSELARLRERLAALQAADEAADAPDLAGADDADDSAASVADDLATSEAADSTDGGAMDDSASLTESGDADTADAIDGDADSAATTTAPALTPPVTRTQPTATPVQPPAATSPPPAPAMPWYRNLWVMVGGGALLLGLLLLGVMRMMRGGKAKAEPSRRVSDSLAASAAPTAAGADYDDDGMSDREIELLEALSAQPEDLDRHLELVRYYYEQGNEDAFEGAAEAMYAQCADDPGNLAWRQVVAMGREVIPDHPMFEDAEPLPADEPGDAFDAALSAEVPATVSATVEDVADAADEAHEQAEAAADFSWEEPAAEAESTPPQREEVDFGDFSEPAAPPPVEMPPAPEPQAVAAAPAAAATPSGEVDEDAAATKLELARAYLDMGDIEGARGMLEEVLGEGNPGQRDEARRLLDEIR